MCSFYSKAQPPSVSQNEAKLLCERVDVKTKTVVHKYTLSFNMASKRLLVCTFDVSSDNRFMAAASGDHQHVTMWDLQRESVVARYTIATTWASHEVVKLIVSSRANRVVVILRAVDHNGSDVGTLDMLFCQKWSWMDISMLYKPVYTIS